MKHFPIIIHIISTELGTHYVVEVYTYSTLQILPTYQYLVVVVLTMCRLIHKCLFPCYQQLANGEHHHKLCRGGERRQNRAS